MAEMQSGKLAKISIKDRLTDLNHRLQRSALGRACARLPQWAYHATGAFVLLVGSLMTLSFTLANVVAHQGYEKIAFATPAATGRLIRQAEVAQFGNRVSSAFGINDSVATEFADWILEASERQRLAPELLASLVVTESSFRKKVRSHVGAIGPAQVRPDYWGEFCGAVAELDDPETNVYCGAQVLSHMLERCEGNLDCALAAYNVGPYARTRNDAANRYVEKIDHYLTTLEERSL